MREKTKQNEPPQKTDTTSNLANSHSHEVRHWPPTLQIKPTKSKQPQNRLTKAPTPTLSNSLENILHRFLPIFYSLRQDQPPHHKQYIISRQCDKQQSSRE